MIHEASNLSPPEQRLDVTDPTDTLDWLDLLAVISENLRMLVLGPLLAGLCAVGIGFLLPHTYTSSASLGLNESGARNAETLMRSPAVLDDVLRKFPELRGSTPEERLSRLNNKFRWVTVQGESRKTAAVFNLEVENEVPARAQAINAELINNWIELTKPRLDAKLRLEALIGRTELQLESVSGLIKQLESESVKQLLMPNSLQGEVATPLLALRVQRDRHIESLVASRLALLGTSRDVILSPPSLPVEVTWPRKGALGTIAAIVSGLLLLSYVLLKFALQNATVDPKRAAKIERIRMNFRRRKTLA
jgi:hypothetical protein